MQRLAIVLALFVVACGGSPDPAPQPQPSAAGGTVAVRGEAVSGGHALVIENGTSAVLRVQREIVVERQAGAAWEPVQASWLLVRASCDENDPPACIDIPAGTTFRAAPWNEMFGDAQCACEECGPAGAGSYRFAITPCDGSARLETPTFAVE